MKSQLKLFNETRQYLQQSGLPMSDYDDFDESISQFEAGGHYGIELSSMNNPKLLRKALQFAKEYDVKFDRIIECRGIVRLPDNDIKEMVNICSQENIGLILAIGPRAISDIGAFVASPNGKRVGYRLRGMENIVHAVEDVKRAISFGVTGFLIYDEGLLCLLNKMRKDGHLPKDIYFKYSVHAGCANPLSAQLLEKNGADSINIVPDLDVYMIKSFRQVIKGPLDVFSDTAKAAGGLLRTYDIPDIIRYAAPVYFKCGPISQPEQNHLPTSDQLEERVKQTRNVIEHIERYIPEAKRVAATEKTLSIPKTSSRRTVKLVSNV